MGRQQAVRQCPDCAHLLRAHTLTRLQTYPIITVFFGQPLKSVQGQVKVNIHLGETKVRQKNKTTWLGDSVCVFLFGLKDGKIGP